MYSAQFYCLIFELLSIRIESTSCQVERFVIVKNENVSLNPKAHIPPKTVFALATKRK